MIIIYHEMHSFYLKKSWSSNLKTYVNENTANKLLFDIKWTAKFLHTYTIIYKQ